MVRHAVSSLALVLVALVGCASRSPSEAKSARAKTPQFDTEEQKQLACLDLRDHIVALYADEYVEQQGLEIEQERARRVPERVGRGAGEEGHVRALRAVVLLQPDAAQVPVRNGLADDRRSRRVHEAQLALSASGRSHVTVAG